jgi:hypothetical protein
MGSMLIAKERPNMPSPKENSILTYDSLIRKIEGLEQQIYSLASAILPTGNVWEITNNVCDRYHLPHA